MKRKIVFLSFIGISASLLVFALTNSPKGNGVIASANGLETTMKAAPTSGNPLDYSVIDNLAFLAYNLTTCKNYKSITTGQTTANVVISYVQEIYNEKIVNGNDIFTSTISTSSLVSVAEQKFFFSDRVLLRKADTINGSNTVWSNEKPQMLSIESYENNYGLVPLGMSAYIICAESIIESGDIVKKEDIYQIVVKLDPTTSPSYYQRQVKTLAGATNYPSFSEIELTLEFTKDWKIQTIKTKENYSISISVIPNAACTNEITETFSYGDYEITDFEYFDVYRTLSPSDVLVAKELTAIDYVQSAFGDIIQGKESTYNVKIQANKKELDTNISIDMGTNTYKVFSEYFYITYQDNLYISFNNTKLKIENEEIERLISTLGLDTSAITEELDVDGLLSSLGKADLIHENDNVIMRCQFDILGVIVQATFEFKKSEEIVLEQINCDVKIKDKTIKLIITPTSYDFPPIEKEEYDDCSKVLDSIIDIMNEEAYSLQFSTSINGIELSGELYIDKELNIECLIYVGKNCMEIKYFNGKAYLSFLNVNISVEINDLDDLKELFDFAQEIIEIDTKIDFTKLDLKIEEDIMNITFSPLSMNLDLNNLEMKIDDFEIEKIRIQETKFKLCYVEQKNLSTNKTYIDIKDLYQFKEQIKKLMNAQTLGIAINTTIKLGNISMLLNVDVIYDFDKQMLAISGDIIIPNTITFEDIQIVYVNNMFYFDYNGIHVKLSKEKVISILSKYIVMQDLDIANLIQSLSVVDKEILLTLGVSDSTILINNGEHISITTSNFKYENIEIDNFIATIYETKNEIELNSEYEEELPSNLLDIVDSIYVNKGFGFNISTSILLANTQIYLTGKGTVDFQDELKLSLDLDLLICGTKHDINVVFIEDTIYISYGNINIALTTSELGELLENIKTKYEMYCQNYGLEKKDISLDMTYDVNEIINSIRINADTIEINLRSILEAIGTVYVTINETNILINEIDLGVAAINNLDIDITETIDVITHLEETLTKRDLSVIVDYIFDFLELAKRDSFSIVMESAIYNNNKVRFDVCADVKIIVRENRNVDLYIECDVVSHDNSETSYYATMTVIDGYIYVSFTTSDSNREQYLKFCIEIDELLNVIGILTKLMGIENTFLDEFISSEISSINLDELGKLNLGETLDIKNNEIVVSDYIKTLEVSDEVKLILDGMRIFGVSDDLEIVLGSNNELPYMSISNIYTSTKEDIEKFSLDFHMVDEEIAITKPIDEYYDFSSIGQLLEDIIHTVEYKDGGYHLSGDAKISVLSIINVSVPLDIFVLVDENDNPYFYITLNLGYNGINKETSSSIVIKDSSVFLKREYKNSIFSSKLTTEYRYQSMNYFLENFWNNFYWLTGMDVATSILNITSKIDEALGLEDHDLTSQAGTKGFGGKEGKTVIEEVLKEYSYSDDTYNLVLSGSQLTHDSNVGDIDVRIKRENDELSNLIATLKLVSVVNVTIDLDNVGIGNNHNQANDTIDSLINTINEKTTIAKLSNDVNL